nr:MAG TPA: hypothetical protein [Caudoviricetes sp.]
MTKFLECDKIGRSLTHVATGIYHYTPCQHFCQEKFCTNFNFIFSRYLAILPIDKSLPICYTT